MCRLGRGGLCALALSARRLTRCESFNPLPSLACNLADNSLVHVISGHQKPNARVREQLVECWLAIPAYIGLAESAKRHHWDNAPRMGGDPAALPCSSPSHAEVPGGAVSPRRIRISDKGSSHIQRAAHKPPRFSEFLTHNEPEEPRASMRG